MLEQIKEILKDWESQRGANGTTWFHTEGFFSPPWLQGHHVRKFRLAYNPKYNWCKVEAHFNATPEDEWDTFFEGSLDSPEDLLTIFRLIKYPDKE